MGYSAHKKNIKANYSREGPKNHERFCSRILPSISELLS